MACCQSLWWLWYSGSKWARGGLFILSVGLLCAKLGPEGRTNSVFKGDLSCPASEFIYAILVFCWFCVFFIASNGNIFCIGTKIPIRLFSNKWIHLIRHIFLCRQKICSHRSLKQCQFGFSRVMSVPVSSMSHFHSSATSSPADGRWHSLDLFHNYISVEFIWFIWSMLRNQQPRTPTHRSNWLTTQATAGASSLSTSATPMDQGTSRALSVRHHGLSHALSVLSVPMLTVAASTCLTQSSSTIAATSLPASTTTALPTAGDAITYGLITGKIANPTSDSEAYMPTVCRMITTAQYSNLSDGAVSSDSCIANILSRVSAVLVSMNSLMKWICWLNEFIWLSKWIQWLNEFIYKVPVSNKFIEQMNSSISTNSLNKWIHLFFHCEFIKQMNSFILSISLCEFI